MGNTGSNAFNNTLVISNGGLVTSSGQVSIGNTPTTYGNLVLISQGAWTNAGTSYLVYQGTNNRAVVEGPGAVFHSTGDLYVGYTNSAGSSLLVSNGAVVSSLTGIGVGMRAGNSGTILVTGPGSILRNLQMTMGSISAGSNSWSLGSGSIVVTNGGTLEGNYLRSGYLSSGGISNLGGIYQFFSNSPVIEANTAGTILLNGGAISFRDVANANVKGNWGVGATGRGLTNLTFVGNNTFRLNNSSTTNAGQEYVFDAGRGATNYVGLEMVNGNTAWRSAWLAIGPGGSLLVSNTTADIYGALTNSGNITVASASASYWSNVVLNSGSLYRALAGTNAFNGGLVINDGATMTMDAWSTLTGTVTNNSLLQILTNAVYAVTGGQAPAGNGALNVSWGGALTYSNGAYAGFGGGGVTNNGLVDVQNLAVVTLGGSAGTPSGNGVLRVSGGGALNFGPGSYAVGNTVSNLGTVMVSNALVTFHAPVVIGGTYVSDPSTNVFTTNVTVSASGALVGSNGDLFVFQKDLYMFSTNHTGFNMWQAATLFTNGPSHFLSISNSGAFKLGGGTNLAEFATNFAIGELGIALGDKLTLAGNKDTLTNALYVGWLNIYGLGSGSLLTNDYLAVSNTLVTVLSLDVNLYYDRFDSRNDWLTTYLPDLGYDLWGPNAGLLLPIPEPSALLAVGAGLAVLAFLRRRRA
jgi:T5SS/PEP-CTERM-associated repeat protein